MNRLDVTANRAARKWGRRVLVARVFWGAVQPLFRFSPRPMWGWRRGMLRLFGAQIGREVHVYPSVRITMPWNVSIGDQSAVGDRAILYALGRITIGTRTTISQGAHLCAGTHDLTQPERPLLTPPIEIGSEAWIAADAFIGPGVCIGSRAIAGARAVVVKDVAAGSTVVGNPAKPIRKVTS